MPSPEISNKRQHPGILCMNKAALLSPWHRAGSMYNVGHWFSVNVDKYEWVYDI